MASTFSQTQKVDATFLCDVGGVQQCDCASVITGICDDSSAASVEHCSVGFDEYVVLAKHCSACFDEDTALVESSFVGLDEDTAIVESSFMSHDEDTTLVESSFMSHDKDTALGKSSFVGLEEVKELYVTTLGRRSSAFTVFSARSFTSFQATALFAECCSPLQG